MEKRVSLAWGTGIEFTATSEDGVSVELGGAESPGTFRPAAMLLVALGGCTGMDAISIMTKKRIAVSSYRVEVSGIQKDEHPKPYTSILVEHVVEGTSIDDASVARAVELSARKYCAVGATIAQGETTIEHRTRIIDENGERTCECLIIGPRGAGLAGTEARQIVGTNT
jgi:putative redox protein